MKLRQHHVDVVSDNMEERHDLYAPRATTSDQRVGDFT